MGLVIKGLGMQGLIMVLDSKFQFESKRKKEKVRLKKQSFALAKVAQLVGYLPIHQEVAGLIPGQAT